MTWWHRWRADLARPERARGPQDLPMLFASPVIIVAVTQLTDPGTAAQLAVACLAVGAFAAWALVRRLPAEVFALGVMVPVAVAITGGEGGFEGAFFLVVTMVLYTSWFLGSTSRSVLITVVAAALPWVVATQWVPDYEIGWPAWTSASLFTFVAGRTLGYQRHLIEQLEAARGALAAQAVAEERRRIARELHDLAGHTLAAVLLHVTGARHVLRRDVDEAERALVDAETVGRASLDQIRATVAALRTDERGTDAALAGSADLAALVDEYRRAGLAIEADVAPTAADVEGPTGTALHRIAREALANVARHAPTNVVVLSLEDDPSGLRLRVSDHGRPPAAPATGAGHFGIVGMQERARALGGQLEAGPTADGWAVEALLPLVPRSHDAQVPS
ncbi:MAG: sensor histidine kinase [Acidimicrobiales bacterium]